MTQSEHGQRLSRFSNHTACGGPDKETATAPRDYKGLQSTQTGAQGDATTARKQLEAAIAVIADLRREIQYAADAVWPETDPANAGVRGEFQIPADKALA